MREAIKGGLQPQPWHHGIISTWHHPELPKSDPASAVSQCSGALICLRTSLKSKITPHVFPIWICESIKGGLQPQPCHHGIISTWLSPRIVKIWPSFGSITVWGCTYMPIYLIERCYKHFIYVHYRCGKQSKVVYSLNHDVMASLPPDSHPELPKSDPASAV